jgi:hypothetical protein
VALGDPASAGNIFQWSHLDLLNLLGSLTYQTGTRWISEWWLNGSIAIYDEQVTGPTSELIWAGSSKLAKLHSHFGLQDAAWKWREPSWEPGAWARVMSHSKAGEPIYKLVTQVRWDKTKCVLASITDSFCSG